MGTRRIQYAMLFPSPPGLLARASMDSQHLPGWPVFLLLAVGGAVLGSDLGASPFLLLCPEPLSTNDPWQTKNRTIPRPRPVL